MDAPVDVFVCSGCGAPLAIGGSDVTICPHCRTEVAVPQRHRELRALRDEDASLRARGEAMFARLDRPPSMVAGVLAKALDLDMLAFLLVYGIPVGLASVLWGLDATRWLAHRRHVPEATIPFAVTLAFTGLVLFAFVFVPRAIGVYANRRASGRLILVQALAAKRPTTPGGPSTCRVCGAPLEIREDARVCDCIYCRAQNAVRIRTKLLATTKEAVASLGKSVEDALRTDDAERKQTRTKLASELGRYLVRIVVLLGLFGLAGSTKKDVSFLDGSSLTFVGGASLVALVLCTLFFLYRSFKSTADDDGAERRTGNPAPEWVRYVGPFVLLLLVYMAVAHHC